MRKYYTGIGSRETPVHILKDIWYVGFELATKGLVLRSGGADGADLAFEAGCHAAEGEKEIYLPWKKFNLDKRRLLYLDGKNDLTPSKEMAILTEQLAAKFHPAWESCSHGAKLLHGRNGHQVLGQNLSTPSKFIICWTKAGKEGGGTGQALRIANFYKIPVFNLFNMTKDEVMERVKEYE